MTTDLPGLLVCQETLQPLRRTAEGLWSDVAQRLYPVEGDLVYMGFPVRDQAMIAATMAEEKAWQGTTDTLERDASFLSESAPAAVRFINLIGKHVSNPHPLLLDLGSGSGWVSWLCAEAGYDVYLCDFEANSLTLGLEFEHPGMGVGHRIVGDARYAPFADGTFDVVMFKEFVHHVADFESLFREAARVLRPGGLIAFMEPTMSVLKRLWQIRNPDTHEGHHITWPDRYLRAFRHLNLEPVHVTSIYDERVPRNPVLRELKQRAATRTSNSQPLGLYENLHLRALGAANMVVLARKTKALAAAPRPPMTVIQPSTRTVTPDDQRAYRTLRPIVEDAALGLHRS
jgi:SAM-dependent methyltransferase